MLTFNLKKDNALDLMAILICCGKHFACPKYMHDCINIEGDHVYKIGMDFDKDDGITVILKDSDDYWWVNGNQPPSNIHSLLWAWRHFQSFVSHLSVFWILRLHSLTCLVEARTI